MRGSSCGPARVPFATQSCSSRASTCRSHLPPVLSCLPATTIKAFSATSRTYKYFFVRGSLDIERMRLAAQRLCGEHTLCGCCRAARCAWCLTHTWKRSSFPRYIIGSLLLRLGRVCCALRSQADVEPELICGVGEHDHDVLVFHLPAQIGKALDTYRHGACMQGVYHGYDRGSTRC